MSPSSPSPSPAAMLDMTGKVVVVTGAGGGIGGGIVGRFVAAGATVVAHTQTSPVDQLLDGAGEPVASVKADLTSTDGPQQVIDAALASFGRLDGLVNNAGIQPVVPFAEVSDEDWQSIVDINLTAAHRLTQRAAIAMKATGDGGSVVHVSSIEGRHPTPVHGHYATTKAALVMHAKAAALSYGPDGIRVNAISPGLIDRPGLSEQWPEGVDRWQQAAPLGRLGTPEDIGDACVFLCSELARWVTGVDLAVDGGVLTNATW